MSAAEILKQVPHHLVDFQVSDIHLEELALKAVRWEDFAVYLKLSEAEQEEIRRNNERNYRAQKRAALHLWREKNGMHATYHQLITVFCLAWKADLAYAVKCLLMPQPVHGMGTTDTKNVLKTFRSYLVDCYRQAYHPSQVGWPFSSTAAYVDLPLYDAPIRKLDSQKKLPPAKLVTLDKLLFMSSDKAKRKVVLLEGVAGSGKTTLSWHACQKWAEGLLLQQFSLLIRVSLEDPAIHSASRLADIIPHPSKKFRKDVENAIAEENGKGVCFLLEGFDEASPQLRDFIYSFLSGKSGRSNLPRCSIVVTSRPVASGRLYPLLTSKVVVGRLDKARVDDMLSAYMSYEEGDASPSCNEKDLEELKGMLEQNSLLANLCNLPINTAIVVHLFQCGYRKLPETRTGLFKVLVRNLLLRHIQQRTKHELQEIGDENKFELEDLPGEMFDTFRALSSLAFNGIKQNARVFNSSNLRGEGLQFPFDHLSLMEALSSSFGFFRSFIFLHFSVQEFLAAWHMTTLGSKEQAKAVSHILSSDPLSPVLPFYAGLTGLSNPAAREVLLEVTRHYLDGSNVLANMPQVESADRRRLALALLNCVYESQDPAHCQEIHPPYHSPDPFGIQVECMMSFKFLPLDPSDCLSVGHVMAYHSSCRMDLNDCAIGDAGVKAVLTQLQRSGEKSQAVQKPVLRWLNLTGCTFTTNCMRAIRPTLETVHVVSVSFSFCWPPRQAAPYLKYLIEGLSRRSTFFEIDLSGTLDSAHVHYLVLLFTACPLRFFQLGNTDIEGCMSLMAGAMKHNTRLKELWLSVCNLRNKDLVEFGRTLHPSIRTLVVDGNRFGSSAVVEFLRSQFSSCLTRVDFGRPLNDAEEAVYKQLKKQRRLFPLFVENMVTPHIKTGMKEHSRTVTQVKPSILTRRPRNDN